MSGRLEWRDQAGTLARLSQALRVRGRAVIGLTGGIGSGKSTVARTLAEEGFDVIDADRLARELSQPGERAWNGIVALMGTPDRAEWREKTFRDPELRRRLEAILHPLIREESAKRVASAQSAIVFYEAALLIEAGRTGDLDALAAVVCEPEHQLARVQARDGVAVAQARAVLAAQTTNDARKAAADILVSNDGSPEELQESARRLAAVLRAVNPA